YLDRGEAAGVGELGGVDDRVVVQHAHHDPFAGGDAELAEQGAGDRGPQRAVAHVEGVDDAAHGAVLVDGGGERQAHHALERQLGADLLIARDTGGEACAGEGVDVPAVEGVG